MAEPCHCLRGTCLYCGLCVWCSCRCPAPTERETHDAFSAEKRPRLQSFGELFRIYGVSRVMFEPHAPAPSSTQVVQLRPGLSLAPPEDGRRLRYFAVSPQNQARREPVPLDGHQHPPHGVRMSQKRNTPPRFRTTDSAFTRLPASAPPGPHLLFRPTRRQA